MPSTLSPYTGFSLRSTAVVLILLSFAWQAGSARLAADDPTVEVAAAKKPANPRDTTRPLAERLSDDQPQRILELIYILRNYQVFNRDQEMAEAVYELHKIGSPAVPALIDELDRTDRDQTLRALGIAMRAMDDPRAVPALIRAVPKTLRPPGSDCGVGIHNRELLEFILTLETHPDPDRSSMTVGRPVNEIHRALERLTGHSATPQNTDPLRHVFLGKPEQQEAQRKLFSDRKDEWQSWWNDHGKEFLSAEELARLDQPTPPATIDPQSGLDEVDRAGLAQFGPLFPTGPGVRLGKVHEVELFSASYRDAPSAIDFDRHRTLRFLEGLTDPEEGQSEWEWLQGVDLLVGSGSDFDLRIWVVDDTLWDSIDEEIQKPEPLPVGEAPRGGIGSARGSATLLFNTREGGSGIMQLGAYQKETASKTIRYRLWLNDFTSDEAVAVEPVVETDRRTWGKQVYMLLRKPEPGARFAWSIDASKSVTLPENISADEFKKHLPSHNNPGRVREWKVANSVDFVTQIVTFGFGGGGFGGGGGGFGGGFGQGVAAKEQAVLLNLYMLDSVTAQVRPQSFERMPVRDAVQLLSERSAGERRETKSFYSSQILQPATYLFQTRSNRIGILQIMESSLKQNVVKFRYKLAEEERKPD